MRIAVVGGDDRAKRAPWPKGYEISTYQSSRHGGTGERRRLQNAISAGKIDGVVILARWTGHSEDAVPGNVPRVIWPRGVGELARQIPSLFPLPITSIQTREPVQEETEKEIRVEEIPAAAAPIQVEEKQPVVPLPPPDVMTAVDEKPQKEVVEPMMITETEAEPKRLIDQILDIAQANPDHIFSVWDFATKLGKNNQGRRNTIVERLARLIERGQIEHVAKNAYRFAQPSKGEIVLPSEEEPVVPDNNEDGKWISPAAARYITGLGQSRLKQLIAAGMIHKRGISVGTEYLRADCEALRDQGERRSKEHIFAPTRPQPKQPKQKESKPNMKTTTTTTTKTKQSPSPKPIPNGRAAHFAHVVRTLDGAVKLDALTPQHAADTFFSLVRREAGEDQDLTWALLVEVASKIE